MTKFDVLLSTYNGEAYLKEQLDSILVQSEYLSKIIIRDDGSSDNTIAIIEEYQSQFPELINFINDGTGNMGVKDSFFYLSKFTTSDYMAFCDQDDVWLPEKLATLATFIDTNELSDRKNPVLVHSDLTVVDKSLNRICDSFIGYLGVDGSSTNVADLLIRNTVTGCAAVVNRPLMELAIKHKGLFKYHDECVAVVAALFESVYFIDKPLLLYRQHGNNVVGAPKDNFSLQNRYKTKIYLRFPWCNLKYKVNELILIKDISHESAKKIEYITSVSSMSFIFRIFYLRDILKSLKLSNCQYRRLKYAFFSK
ncbi:glycosyltransferase family 2 protein [Shewanella sp. GXUN23E]|uniref:glycosyltransferase family 2 protein n=1 Tax=Shewanella sp. GXUN23E TaxID=3422498 RepID=UPI003D7C7494